MFDAVILARSGSKKIKNKNLINLNGITLIEKIIYEAKKSKKIQSIYFLTDSKKYANLAYLAGAKIPFLRTKKISSDNSRDFDTFEFFYKWLKKNKITVSRYFVHLRVTSPFVSSVDIDRAINKMSLTKNADSLKSVELIDHYTPYKMWKLKNNQLMEPLVKNTKINEPWNSPRQNLPKVYFQNAQIDIFKTSLISKGTISGKKIIPFELNDFKYIDIDKPIDIINLENIFNLTKKIKKIAVDIDGVIASINKSLDYKNSKPIKKNIKSINAISAKGVKILLFTSRGYETGIDWKKFTILQMKKWGVSYSKIYFSKPNADLYIDDKALTPGSLMINKFKI